MYFPVFVLFKNARFAGDARVQTVEGYPAQTALRQALIDLKALTGLTKQKFLEEVDRFQSEDIKI